VPVSRPQLSSVMSTESVKYMNTDLKGFYLKTSMKRFQYAHFKVDYIYISEETMNKHNLWELAHKKNVYIRIQKVYSLPQAGRLANERLKGNCSPTEIMSVHILLVCSTMSLILSIFPYG